MKKTIRQFKNFEDDLRERLANYNYVKTFLSVAWEEFEKDGDVQAFLLALKDVAMAQGGISKLARHTKLNRPNLQRTLSAQTVPRLDTIGTILQGLGYRFSVESIREKIEQ